MKAEPRKASRGIATTILLAASLICIGSASQALEKTESRTTKPGKAVSLGGFMLTDKDCQGKRLPQASIVRPPEYGTICFEIAKLRSTLRYADPPKNPHCKGQLVRGVRILYASAPGFTGSDSVIFTILYPTLELRQTVNIQVKGEGDFIVVDRPPDGTITTQKPGPVPRCVPLVS